MGKTLKIFAVLIIGILHSAIGQFSADAQITTGVYSVTVNTPGTFGQVMIQTVENWSDVLELSVTGYLNNSDMAIFSRMQNMIKLDLEKVEIKSITGCEGLKFLQTVVLPESVRWIEDNAFKSCTSLSTINLGQIEAIGSSAFMGTNLTGELHLTNLKTLGTSAFYACTGLKTVEMPNVTVIGNYAFKMAEYNFSENEYISMLTTVTMPNVESLGASAFDYCDNLQSISIPKCINLGSNCFSGCSRLTSVILSDKLEYIPENAFLNTTSLKSIKFPLGLKVIDKRAFASSQLSEITLPEGLITIESEAFSCPLESITLPSTLEYIGNDAFYFHFSIWNPNSSSSGYEYSYVLKDVYCNCVVPIVTSTFDNEMAQGATLHVPAFSISAYKLNDSWYKFKKIEAIEGDLSDVTINNIFDLIDYSGLSDKTNLTLTSLSTQSKAAHLTVGGEGVLSLNDFIQNQNFIFKRDGYRDENGKYLYQYSYPYCTTLIANSDVRANSVITKILLPSNKWSFISMPYDVNVSNIKVPEGTMWVIRKYNGSNRAAMSGLTWEDITNGEILNAGEGYIIHCINESQSDYLEFEFPAIDNSNKNNIFRSSDIIKTVKEYPAEFSHNRGWNLIGNPYPSYMNSKCIEFPAPITIWNGDGYTAYSLADDEYVLRPNEAFFVQCPVNTDQIKFYKNGRTHDFSGPSLSNNSRAMNQSSEHRSILNFIISDEYYSDRTRLVLNETAGYNYEIERDASKFMSSNEDVPQIYIIDNGIKYAIDERPLGTGEYCLGVRIGEEGNYNISLNSVNSDYDIYLIDNEADETINLLERTYTFESKPQTANNRFMVKILDKNSQSAIVDIATDLTGYTINGNQLTVDQCTPISVYSIDGKLIYKGIEAETVELPSGIYLLSVENKTHKIVIK